MPRIPYVRPDELPAEKRSLLDSLSEVDPEDRDHHLEGGTLNVYRALGNNVELLETFRKYGSSVWKAGGLDSHERETVILSTSYHSGCAYEWHQHVRIALDEGMTRSQIRTISSSDLDPLEPPLAAIVQYVERFVDGTVDDTTHEQLSEHYDAETILGIGMLAGCYLGLSRILQALDIETEVEFVGWDLEQL